MLLAQVRPDAIGTSEGVLRGVFESGDAWLETGDLFRRDVDGDFWLVDHVPALIRTAGRVVSVRARSRMRSATVDAIALSIAYGVPTGDGGSQIPCVAVTLREGRELDIADVQTALSDLGDGGIPQVIRVVDEIPLTTWFRPQSGPLRAAGIPAPTKPPTSWYWDPRKGGYRPMSKAAAERLLGSGPSVRHLG